MQHKMNIKFIIATLFFFSVSANSATSLNDINADTVSLKVDCGTSENCAEDMFELMGWIWASRSPSALKPLLVNIGPGTFKFINPANGYAGSFCNGGGHVTFRGAGRNTTTIIGPGKAVKIGFLNETAVLHIQDCDQLSFESLSIRADLFEENAAYTVGWVGGGSSTWNNVELVASYYPWVDVCSGNNEISTHTWFGSTFISNGTGVLNTAYRSDCGSSEIHGSNLLVNKSKVNSPWSMIGVQAGSKGQVALYGSSVRVIVPATADANVVYSNQSPSYAPSYGHGGLLAIDGGIIHMHGGIISVRHERNDVNSSVFGVRSFGAGSAIHTPDTAFGLKASGSGVVARIMLDGGKVSAPFQWPAGETPPAITSLNGADTFVETDCNTLGQCVNVPAAEQMPHMMIYNANCSAADPWFDSSLNQCRNLQN